MRTLTIVGEAPSKSSDPKRPFCGASGRTLAKFAGLGTYEELARAARLVNVLPRWPGNGFAGEKGSRFPIVRARRAAKRLKFEKLQVVLLAGKRVAAALGIEFTDYFNWKLLPRGEGGALVWFALIPHPSGCNRYLNYPKNRRRFETFLHREVGLLPKGFLSR